MRIFIHKRYWIIFLLGILGIVVIRQVYNVILTGHNIADLPDYSRILDSNANWGQYQKLNLGIAAFKKGWSLSNDNVSEQRIAEFEQKMSEESLMTQSAQIRQIYLEEKGFRENEQNEAFKLYQTRLYQELELDIAVKTAGLKSRFDKEINTKELEVRNAFEKYNRDLEQEYRLTLANLQFQLLLVDLSGSQEEPVEKKKIQSQIDQIHQEMHDKIEIQRRQLSSEYDDFKKKRQIVLNFELEKLRNQSGASTAEELAKYRQALEQGFQNWLGRRKLETEAAVKLRKK